LVLFMPLEPPGISTVSELDGRKLAEGWNVSVFGDACDHCPGTAGERDGMELPVCSGAEKVIVIHVSGATFDAPGVGATAVMLRAGNVADFVRLPEPLLLAPARFILPLEPTITAAAATTAIPATINSDAAPLWLLDRPFP
jgi:hypothetical protein